jgi:hypothetical protein
MGLKDINLRRALKSFPYIIDGTPQQFQANGGVVHGIIKGVHGGLLPNDEPPHPQTHTALDDSVGAKGTPQYINVKGGPAETIPFPDKYDPNVGGIHGGIEGPVPAQPPHPIDHSTLDDAPLSGVNPQTFIYNGYTVLGVSTPIESKFVDGDNADWPSQTMMSGQIAGRTASQPEGVGSLGNPQTFTISHAGGEATITGLQGEFDISELDLLAEKSLLMKTWKGSVELDLANFPAPKFYNPDGWKSSETHGTNFTWPTYRGLGTSSPEKQPFRFGGGHAKQGFTVNLFGAKTIEGPLVEDVVDNYTRLVKESGFWGNFIGKQSSLQESSIYKQDVFTTFDGILFEMGFEPGTRAVRIGNAFKPNTKPAYTKDVPIGGGGGIGGPPTLTSNKYKGLKGVKHNSPIDVEAGKFEGDMDYDYDSVPKLLYLYDNMILREGEVSPAKGWQIKNDFNWKVPGASGTITSEKLSDMSDSAAGLWSSWVANAMQGYDYPIIPSMNLINSTPNYTTHVNARYFTKKALEEEKTGTPESELTANVLEEASQFIGKDQITKGFFQDGTLGAKVPRMAFLLDTIIFAAKDSAAFTQAWIKHMGNNKDELSYISPPISSLTSPHGTSAMGIPIHDAQPHISDRPYIEKSTWSDFKDDQDNKANPFYFYSKMGDTSNGMGVLDGEDKLHEQSLTNFFGDDEKNKVVSLKDPIGPHSKGGMPTIKSYMTSDEKGKTEKTKIVPRIVGGVYVPDVPEAESEEEKITSINADKMGSQTANTIGLLHKYSTLAYPALGASDVTDQVDAGGAKSLLYSETLRSPGEMNETIKAEFGGKGLERPDWLTALSGPEKDDPGARDAGKKKVYAIGRQGLIAVGVEDADKVVSADGKAVLTKGVNGKYIVGNDYVDKVNAIPYGSRVFGPDKTDAEDLDFIPLIFHDLWNKKDIVFRTMNLGSIIDTITPEWTEQDFIGRSVAAATYSKTDRKFSFDFDVYPKTRQEFPILLEKVNYLVGLCYPNLDKFMRQAGPLIKLTVGDILRSQMGYLTGCTVTFPDDSPWEIDRGLRFTKRINIDIDFTYIGGYIPIATGKHYGLSWLDGQSMANTGVGYENYPGRNKGTVNPDEDGNKLPGVNALFKELDQA